MNETHIVSNNQSYYQSKSLKESCFSLNIHVHTTFLRKFNLKVVSAIFYQIFIFAPNGSPSKIMENVFYVISKALFVLEIFKFL